MSDTTTPQAALTEEELAQFAQWRESQSAPRDDSPSTPAPSNAVQIKATVRQPINLEYPAGSGDVFTLTGRIPPEILTIQSGYRRPKNASKEAVENHTRELGAALIGAFFTLVIPEDFKNVLDLEDIDQVFTIWSEHVGLGESKPS
ncbi:hypothetical protein AS850_02670 [Frondihabitans sp. 762G35]|uniref:hypothetical protein n=1 Tax=Frondihabitans sp. 762G35 TaxID=1446794 RepID=UPI000D228409|nr:hypothetical protein [Frondihabitans sp. 762G35]ARC55976.1 hypothetical protein AS850_02670 [Frondihabitans sp. 762G35]